jgi:DNA-directed RNA polymerase subunit RPC12/RpoP
MAIPLTRTCLECEAEMELITVDDGGEVVIYECPECGHQVELRLEDENDEPDDGVDDAQEAEEDHAVRELLEPEDEG